jgi:hypothetical protein
MVCEGPILLARDKVNPVCRLATDQRNNTPVIHHMGEVDISPILDKFASSPPQLWDPQFQATQNVHMIRPAHDNWGIGKIVLTFCDDYMSTRYEFPWWKEWKSVVEPIYQAFGIPSERVVRCLFASMPPGAFIKVHHDTGLWVKHTHRVHVPITTNSKVKFWVGSTNESLEVYPFSAGHVIELNNQAKHQVINEGEVPRIHMIFDYVDADIRIPPSIILTPAQRLHQTRRSMDLEGTPPKYPFPAFVIAGVTRCLDHSVCEFETPEHRLLRAMLQHPLFHPSHHSESFSKPGNFLDENWNYGTGNDGDLSKEETKGKNCGGADLVGLRRQYLKHFDVAFMKPRASLVSGELGATYLRHGERTARRLKAIAPATKLIVVLHDPVLRAEMHFRDLPSDSKKESFETLVEADLALLRAAGIHKAKDATPEKYKRYWKTANHREALVGAGLYEPQLALWATYLSQRLVLQADDSRVGLQRNLDRISNFLGLPDSHELDPEPDVAKPFVSSLSSEHLTVFFQECAVGSLAEQYSSQQ